MSSFILFRVFHTCLRQNPEDGNGPKETLRKRRFAQSQRQLTREPLIITTFIISYCLNWSYEAHLSWQPPLKDFKHALTLSFQPRPDPYWSFPSETHKFGGAKITSYVPNHASSERLQLLWIYSCSYLSKNLMITESEPAICHWIQVINP